MSWNWRQRRARLLLGVAIAACALALVRPELAHAGYPLAASGKVLLGFGASYTSAEATSASTHRGVDIAAEPGASVRAPFAGTVTFAGRIPAVGGGTVRAVTLSTQSGSITLLPLGDLSVAKGDSLSEGDTLGTVAEGGDGSSSGTHLHVGVKRGDLYVDPMSVLTLPTVASPPPSNTQPAAAGSKAGAAVPVATPVGAATVGVTGGASSKSPSAVPHLAPGGAGAGASVQALVGAGVAPMRHAVPGTRVASGVSIGGVAPEPAPTVATLAAQRALAPLGATGGAVSRATQSVRAAGTLLDALAASARKGAGRALRVGGIGAAAVLGGIGLLWPLWRREEQKGSGEERVSAIADDIAAAVGR